MKTYVTEDGDVWDKIAHDTMGSSLHTAELMRANSAHIRVSVFPRGVTLKIPEVPTQSGTTAAPWRKDVV